MSERLSRTKLEMLMECPRCFWLDQKMQIKRPPGFPFTLNSAIDKMLKDQFDECREKKIPHPVMTANQIKAIPFNHPNLGKWRANASGIRWEDPETGFELYGAMDDVWEGEDGELYICDFKATGAKQCTVYPEYKRQIEVYQFLFRQNGFKVSSTGYWLFAHVQKDKKFEDNKLEFKMSIQHRYCDTAWVPLALQKARQVLDSKEAPACGKDCDFCEYLSKVAALWKTPPQPSTLF